jgi:hypothetical protein
MLPIPRGLAWYGMKTNFSQNSQFGYGWLGLDSDSSRSFNSLCRTTVLEPILTYYPQERYLLES